MKDSPLAGKREGAAEFGNDRATPGGQKNSGGLSPGAPLKIEGFPNPGDQAGTSMPLCPSCFTVRFS